MEKVSSIILDKSSLLAMGAFKTFRIMGELFIPAISVAETVFSGILILIRCVVIRSLLRCGLHLTIFRLI